MKSFRKASVKRIWMWCLVVLGGGCRHMPYGELRHIPTVDLSDAAMRAKAETGMNRCSVATIVE